MVHLSENAPLAVLVTIVLNFALFLPLKAVRWRVVLLNPPPFPEVFAATIEGLLANAAIGFGSGDVVRAARIRRNPGDLAVDYACTWAERGAEFVALAVLVFVAALVASLGAVAVSLSGVAVVLYAAVLATGRFLVPRLGRWPRVARALSAGLEASTPRRVAAMAGVTLLGWAVELVMLVLFQSAFDLEPSFRMALLTLVGINAAIVVPTSPGNFGLFEAGATAALVMCGVPSDVAISFAVTYHLAHVIPIALVATVVYLVRSRRSSTTPERTPMGS